MNTLTLPWPPKELSPNSRCHYMAKARAAKKYRAICAGEAIAEGWHFLNAETYGVRYTFCPPSKRKHDLDNCIASFKAGQDGLCDILNIDDHGLRPLYSIGDPVKGGRVLVELAA